MGEGGPLSRSDPAAGGRPPWVKMYALRQEVRKRFRDPLGLPLARRPELVAASMIPQGSRVVDVGSGDGSMREKLSREGLSCDYTSVDPGGGADFESVAEAPGPFDAALLFEVLEHLGPDTGADLLRSIRDKVRPGGLLVVSVPNVFKPGQQIKDSTHLTPYPWDELGAVLAACGWHLEAMFRVYNAPMVSRFLHLRAFWLLHRFLEIDCARSVMAVGRKP